MTTPNAPAPATRAQRSLLARHAALARRRGWRSWAADLLRAARNPELSSAEAVALSICAVGWTWPQRGHGHRP